MQRYITVTLSEEDVNQAIKDFVKNHYHLEVKNIRMQTSVRGNYDHGDAQEYVSVVWCDVV